MPKEEIVDSIATTKLGSVDSLFLNLEVLYSFESTSMIISEFKRRDIDESSSPDKRFFWMIYDKISKKLDRLSFVSMNSEKDIEYRTFFQGTLEFNRVEAKFETDGKVTKLYSQKIFSDDYIQTVLAYFDGLTIK